MKVWMSRSYLHTSYLHTSKNLLASFAESHYGFVAKVVVLAFLADCAFFHHIIHPFFEDIEVVARPGPPAANGSDGLKSIENNHNIALVLSDVIMAGGMNGPEMVAHALKLRPDLRVLFMSGYAPGSVRQMNDLPQAIELVAKPFTRADLTDKVRRAIAA